MKTYPVKFYNDKMQGAPTHEAYGLKQLINTLTPVLVTGFGETVCDSLVFDATKGWAKATFASGHKFQKHSVIEILNASVADYNGEHRIMLIDTNNVWFELDTVPSGDATGSSMKYPSLGWEITHESGNGEQVIYAPKGDQGDVSLYIDNSEYSGVKVGYGRTARVIMVTDVVDINTWTKCFTANENADYWQSGGDNEVNINGNGADRFAWQLIGNGSIFNYLPAMAHQQYRYCGYTAGYIDSYRVADRFHFVMFCGHAKSTQLSGNSWGYKGTAANYCQIARDHHQQSGDCVAYVPSISSSTANVQFSQSSPNVVDNGFYVSGENQMVLTKAGSTYLSHTNNHDSAIRGEMPILREVIARISSGFIEKNNSLLYIEQQCSAVNSTQSGDSYEKTCAFDISTVEV
ncbi:hypothetical protein [Psychromonas sp. MME2]|uniref:hypothetical protein n=1 Tax=unclassified Psychromonas TaxID=2614957 RepID=UPI00339BCA4E